MALREVLRIPAFRGLWLGQSISTAGDSLYAVAVAALVLDQGSAADLGLVLGARALGSAALLLFGGAAADRWPRASVMLWANVARAVALLGLVTSPVGVSAPLLAVAALILGAGEAFFLPAYAAVLPGLVPHNQLQAANAATAISTTAGQALGPAVAGLLVVLVGPRMTLLLDAASFVASWVSLVWVRRALVAPASGQSTRTDLLGGVREVRRRPWLVAAIAGGAVMLLAGLAPLLVLLPLEAHARGSSGSLYSIWLTAFAIGSIMGATVANRTPRRCLGLYAQLGLVPVPIAMTAIAGGAPSALVAASLVLVGVGYSLYGVLWSTAVQRDVPAGVLGRVVALDATVAFALMPVGYALAGYLATRSGVTPVLTVGAVVALGAALLPLLVPGGVQYRSIAARDSV